VTNTNGVSRTRLRHRASRLKWLKVLNGSIRYYSTEQSEPNELHSVTPDTTAPEQDAFSSCHGDTAQGSEIPPTPNEAPTLSAETDADRHEANLLGPDDYDGLGDALIKTPKQALYSEFVNKGLMNLNFQVFDAPKCGFQCSVECKMRGTSQVVTVHGFGKNKVRPHICQRNF
jgi:hypothetical protein